jgi:hypothetical protein
LHGLRGSDRTVEQRCIAQRHLSLHRAGAGIENVAETRGRAAGAADYEMINQAHSSSFHNIFGRHARCAFHGR